MFLRFLREIQGTRKFDKLRLIEYNIIANKKPRKTTWIADHGSRMSEEKLTRAIYEMKARGSNRRNRSTIYEIKEKSAEWKKLENKNECKRIVNT